MNVLDEDIVAFEFCAVQNTKQVKEHIHVQYSDGALSTALCGHSPDYHIRKRNICEIKPYLSRSTCRNCLIIYEQLRKIRFMEEHQIMKRLLNREMMIK